MPDLLPSNMQTSFPKDKIKILLLENINAEAIHAFQEMGYTDITTHKSAMSEAELIEAVKQVHVLGIRSKTQLTKTVFDHAERLLAVGCFCIGTNQVDLQEARKTGVAVFNAPYSNTRSVAELVIGAIIMLMRKVPQKNKLAHEGIWMKASDNCHEVRGKVLGIIGYGNIGSQVSVMAEAIGMKVQYYDIQKKLPLGNARPVADLKALFKISDVISVHTPSLPQTQNLINEATLQYCKPNAVIINYARGEVLDTEALVKAIDDKRISGAALDVYKIEPQANGDAFECSLRGKENVLLTPHIGGSTEEAQANIGIDVSTKIIEFIETGATYGSHTIPVLDLSPMENAHRILHTHQNIPGVLSEINTLLSDHGINILAQYLKTNEEIGYVVLDVDTKLSANAFEILKQVKGTIKLRLLY
ncbi:MAG TPA: phosphoglycerate dehydrogenase [Flavipsychrobacter sp.]|nr:phosphoglycerate dehydrogenase [Flavipsychrobacter sp.]